MRTTHQHANAKHKLGRHLPVQVSSFDVKRAIGGDVSSDVCGDVRGVMSGIVQKLM